MSVDSQFLGFLFITSFSLCQVSTQEFNFRRCGNTGSAVQ